ncbi:hypothetical protein WJ68_05675 [Burkholderia ubonensis]|uniref:Thioesterase domain-containing protein n=2 Tax=Burkholderia ubonensis TaxID=101571 RepID=A0ABD4E6I1_9BURK|nr:hypothetical protein WJ68_05675 [Burkholderia ubonensis]
MASSYSAWRQFLPPWLKVSPIELPGRGARFNEPFIRSFVPLVNLVAQKIVETRPSRYALFGHSFGALLAFECGHLMRATGHPLPIALYAACCPAPSLMPGNRHDRHWSDEALVREIQRLQGTPQEVLSQPELRRIVLDRLAADFAVCRDYRYESGRDALAWPIHVFGGADDRDVPRDALHGWQCESKAGTTVRVFPGGHFFFSADHAALLASLQQSLADLVRHPVDHAA